MNETEIIAALDELADLQLWVQGIRLELEGKKRDAVPAEVHLALAALDEEYQGKIASAEASIAALKAKIEPAMLERFEASVKQKEKPKAVKGKGAMVWANKGRVTWNTDALDVLATLEPKLAQYRTEGKPYVQFRFG